MTRQEHFLKQAQGIHEGNIDAYAALLKADSDARKECAEAAENGALECLKHCRCGLSVCAHPECSEQRSMAKACRNVAEKIRATMEPK